MKRSRLSQVLQRLEGLGLVVVLQVKGCRRLALDDRGLAMLARRDRAAVGAARKRWSVAPIDPQAPLTWRNASGRRSRQLLRNAEHTDSVHCFVAALSRQARSQSEEIVQIDPPRRASRYFWHYDKLRSVQPDAFGVLRRAGKAWPFFLEWERRAVRPVTMVARIAPYLRYYSSHRPTDDHGTPSLPSSSSSRTRSPRHTSCASQVRRWHAPESTVPLLVSHRSLLERVGPLGRAWRSRDGYGTPDCLFTTIPIVHTAGIPLLPRKTCR